MRYLRRNLPKVGEAGDSGTRSKRWKWTLTTWRRPTSAKLKKKKEFRQLRDKHNVPRAGSKLSADVVKRSSTSTCCLVCAVAGRSCDAGSSQSRSPWAELRFLLSIFALSVMSCCCCCCCCWQPTVAASRCVNSALTLSTAAALTFERTLTLPPVFFEWSDQSNLTSQRHCEVSQLHRRSPNGLDTHHTHPTLLWLSICRMWSKTTYLNEHDCFIRIL